MLHPVRIIIVRVMVLEVKQSGSLARTTSEKRVNQSTSNLRRSDAYPTE